MNKNPNMAGINRYNDSKARINRERVIDAINICKREGNIYASRVCKMAGVAPPYFNNHPLMKELLEKAIQEVEKAKNAGRMSDTSKDTVIKQLDKKVKSLERELGKKDREIEKLKPFADECSELKKGTDSLKTNLMKWLLLEMIWTFKQRRRFLWHI